VWAWKFISVGIYNRVTNFYRGKLTAKKVAVTLGLLASLVAVPILMLYLLVITGALGALPDVKELSAVENPIASEVYSADSVLLGRYFIQERSFLSFEELPKSAVDALLATEDIRFYEHGAVDKRSLGRVLIKSILLQQDAAGGGSTLTQQLAKNLYPRRSYAVGSMPINKMREMVIAGRLEKIYDKHAILALYLNTVSFGENTFGLEAAAQRFFSRSARSLTVDQAAVLIGMLKATNTYNPRTNPARSLSRRNMVLTQMKKYGLISSRDFQTYSALPIELKYNKITHHSGLAPYFRDYIREELTEWCKKYNSSHDKPINLFTSGLKIYTTIDSRMQRYAEEAVKHQMSITQTKFNAQWGRNNLLADNSALLQDAIRQSDRYRSMKSRGMSDEQIMKVMRTPVTMNVLTDKGDEPINMSPVDSLRHYLKFLHTGFLAMDPRDGSIRAWVGGINHEYFQFDHVRESTKRQVGSTFKPIVYAAALEQGARPCEFISAGKVTYTNMEDWTPKNTAENYDLKYSMPGALAYSVNTVSVRVLEKAGIDHTIALAERMGITSDLPKVPSLALGSADISMMEMVTAYTAFANQGKVAHPFYIASIVSQDGKVLEQYKPASTTRALSSESAQLILHMLRRAVNEGTSSALRTQFALTNDIAGKTGTTQSNTDGWFMAVTPKLIIGTWVGADIPQLHFRTTAMGQGARTALPITAEFLQLANKDRDLKSITRARFPALSSELQSKITCEAFKEDKNFIQKLFGITKKDKKREFGKPKKGLLEKLLGTKRQ
jgi:penicillin-binding protein 1A